MRALDLCCFNLSTLRGLIGYVRFRMEEHRYDSDGGLHTTRVDRVCDDDFWFTRGTVWIDRDLILVLLYFLAESSFGCFSFLANYSGLHMDRLRLSFDSYVRCSLNLCSSLFVQ